MSTPQAGTANTPQAAQGQGDGGQAPMHLDPAANMYYTLNAQGVKYYWDMSRGTWLTTEQVALLQKQAASAEEQQNRLRAMLAQPGDAELAARKAEAKAAAKKKRAAKSTAANTTIYLTGLPDDVADEEVKGFCGKCGLFQLSVETEQPLIKIYRTEEGICKGDARVTYLQEPSVNLALAILDGADIRPGVAVQVSRATFDHNPGSKGAGGKLGRGKKRKLDPQAREAAAALRKKQLNELAWDKEVYDQDVPKAQRIVILQPMFTLQDLKAPDAVTELKADIRREVERYGEVEKVSVFENNAAGVVAVRYRFLTSVQEAVEGLEGRMFAGHPVHAEVWDGKTNYAVREAQEEEEKRIEEFGAWLEGGDSSSSSSDEESEEDPV